MGIIDYIYIVDISMILMQEFEQLETSWKQKYLLDIFSVVTLPSSVWLWDIVDLLQSWFVFSDATLATVYQTVVEAIQQWKVGNADAIQQQLQKIHTLLEDEANKSSLEADDILLDI